MENATSYFVNDPAWVERKRAENHKGIRDTNVFTLNFKDLPNYKNLLTLGDPITCPSCKAILNSKSTIVNSKEYKEKYQEVEESKEAKQFASKSIEGPIAESESVWVCEFCDTHTKLKIQPSQIPKTTDTYYLLQEAAKDVQMKKEKEATKDTDPDISVIFCLDVSGSMNSFTGSKTSLNWMKDAISTQIRDMASRYPQRKVGVVLFGNTANLGMKSADPGKIRKLWNWLSGTVPENFEPIEIKEVNSFEAILNTGQKNAKDIMGRPISENSGALLDSLAAVSTTGSTALGPGVLAALGLAMQGKPGSQVILCTDGLANVGLGSLNRGGGDHNAAASAFYNRVGGLAKDCGVSISIITIKGSGARVDILGQMCELTNGIITKVAGSDMMNDVNAMMQDEVVGTKAEIEIHLHKGLKFRNEDENLLSKNGSLLKKPTGNVTRLTDMTFEYEMKNVDLLTMEKVDMEKLTVIPFQAQITFTATNGDRCLRVITQQQKTTKDVGMVEKEANVEMIQKRVVRNAAELGKAGRWKEAEEMNNEANDYVEELASKNPKAQEKMEKIRQWNSKMKVATINMQRPVSQEEADLHHATVAQYTNHKYL